MKLGFPKPGLDQENPCLWKSREFESSKTLKKPQIHKFRLILILLVIQRHF